MVNATGTAGKQPAAAAPALAAHQPDPLRRIFREPIPPMYAMIVIGLLVGFFYLVMEPWTVGGGETEITGLLAYAGLGKNLLKALPFWNGQVFYIDPEYWKAWISIGLFSGALFGALMSGDFKLRLPRSRSEWVLGAIGGMLMGIGIRLSFICNVSTFFGTATGLNLAGYLAIIGIVVGGYVGSKIYARIAGL
ncbi:MAG TPA: YeeE/YedE thiosulfate transporter family protein [Trebonia sp.]|nr:YeeE/YedE thiosulfate transporter family protein [Trebonia sp.]